MARIKFVSTAGAKYPEFHSISYNTNRYCLYRAQDYDFRL